MLLHQFLLHLILCVLMFGLRDGIQIRECESGNVTVPENQEATLTCEQYNSTISWGWNVKILDNLTTVYRCNETSCYSEDTPVKELSVTYLSPSSSRLTTTATARNTTQLSYGCEIVFCRLQIAYGPDTVTIPENTTFVTDSAGSLNLTLTCVTVEVSPQSGLLYTWTGPCASFTNSACTFKPRPPHDDRVFVTCAVTNIHNNNRTVESNDFVLDLKYPPLSSPVISGFNQGFAHAGDNLTLTLTCVIDGGDPPVTSVTLTCPGHHDQEAIAGQSSSLTIAPLTSNDHGVVCICTGEWTVPSHYIRTANITLNVYYPPSSPMIARVDTLPYPYLENDTVRLSCDLQSWGNPAANLSWVDIENTGTAPPNQALQLQFSAYRSRNVTCQAANIYRVLTTFDVQVYYAPIIFTTERPNNTCSVIFDLGCIVTEGQRIHFRCDANSNPPPANFTWKAPSVDGLEAASGHDLEIMSANRSLHHGVFHCMVATEKNSNDTRLPLTATKELEVVVKYKASDMTLSLNSGTGNLTVDEKAAVALDCQVYGRPTPTIRFTKQDTVIGVFPGGELSPSKDLSSLSHTLTSAKCEDAAEYKCAALNEVGGEIIQTARLFVNCAPRRPPNVSPALPSVDFKGHPVHLTFDLIAYPAPDTFTFAFLGRTQDEADSVTEDMRDVFFSVECKATSAVYAILCNVTAHDFRSTSETGFYRMRVGSHIGRVDIRFYVNVTHVDVVKDERWKLLLTIHGSVLSVLLTATAIVCTCRRLKRKREMSQSGQEEAPDYLDMSPRQENPFKIEGHDCDEEIYDRPMSIMFCEGSDRPLERCVSYQNIGCDGEDDGYISMAIRQSQYLSYDQLSPYANSGPTQIDPCYQNTSKSVEWI